MGDHAVPTWRSCRYSLAFLAFFSSTSIYLLRINFSVAIVCMTTDNVTVINATAPAEHKHTGEFAWDRELRGFLSSSFFFGYVLTQIPGGWLAQRYGGKLVILVGILISSITTLLCPTAARISPYALSAMRFINGLGQGVYFPSSYAICGRWFPLKERGLLLTIWMSGVSAGSMVSLGLSGIICDELGWQWIFYIYGTVMGVYSIVWYFFMFNTPQEHPRITEAELKYIESSIESHQGERKKLRIPWCGLLTSPVLWSLVIYDFCSTWAMYMGLTQLPQYMQDVLHFDIKSNGLYNALPQLAKFCAGLVFAVVGDIMIRRKLCPVLTTRKVFHTLSMVLPAVFVVHVGALDENSASIAVVILTMQEMFAAGCRAGANVVKVDIAPNFAGIVNSLCNTSANIPGIIVPMVVGAITKDGTQEQWKMAFYMSAAFYFIGWLPFIIFGSTDVQEWAKIEQDLQDKMEMSGEDNSGFSIDQSEDIAVSNKIPENNFQATQPSTATYL